MLKYLIISFLVVPTIIFGQADFMVDEQPCGLEGSAKPANVKQLNRLKNRSAAPTKAQIDPQFNWAELAKFEDDRNKFSFEKGAILRGYVLRVKMSEAETCNCNSKTPDFRDTHLIITPDAENTGVLNQIVVEITPRLRAQMQARGVDWSQEALKKLRGKYVEIEGWLFYDYNHGNESAKIRQKTKGVTRSTAWEIHPVTTLKVN